jgi:hypothetical protein
LQIAVFLKHWKHFIKKSVFIDTIEQVMLKKASHIFLSALLLISTMGMAVSKHYCGKNLVSVSFYGEADSCCGDSDCCHNENQNFQIKDDFSAPHISNIPALAEFDIFEFELLNDFFTDTYKSKNTIQVFSDSPPPPKIQKTLSLKQLYLL